MAKLANFLPKNRKEKEKCFYVNFNKKTSSLLRAPSLPGEGNTSTSYKGDLAG